MNCLTALILNNSFIQLSFRVCVLSDCGGLSCSVRCSDSDSSYFNVDFGPQRLLCEFKCKPSHRCRRASSWKRGKHSITASAGRVGHFLVVTSLFPTVQQTLYHVSASSGVLLLLLFCVCVCPVYWTVVWDSGHSCLNECSYRSHGVGVRGHRGHFLFLLKTCAILAGDKRVHGGTCVAQRK